MNNRTGWAAGALAGSLAAGAAISALMVGKERLSGEPSDLIQWERVGAERLGVDLAGSRPTIGEQALVHGAHMALSAFGGAAYALVFDEDAPVVASGLAFGAAFYAACHWLAGPMLRLKPPEWREPPATITQHIVVHAAYGLLIALGAHVGADRAEPSADTNRS